MEGVFGPQAIRFRVRRLMSSSSSRYAAQNEGSVAEFTAGPDQEVM